MKNVIFDLIIFSCEFYIISSSSFQFNPYTYVIMFTFVLYSQTGTTALFFAAQGGYMDIAGLLLEHGAIVDSCSIVSREEILARVRAALAAL